MSEKQMPDSWATTRLDSVVKFEGGSQPPKSDFIFKEKQGYVRLIQIRDFRTDEFKTYIPERKARKFFNENDIMIGRYGPPIFQILRGLSGAYNVALMKATPSSIINRDFLYYFLQNPEIQNAVEVASIRSAGQSGVNQDFLGSYPMVVPPLKEQQRIVSKIESTQDKIKTIEESVSKAEELIGKYRESLLQKAFRGQLVPQDPKDEPASFPLEKIRKEHSQNPKGKKADQEFAPIVDDEESFELPAGWEWVRLGEVLKVSSGKMLSAKNQKGGEIPVYGGNGITGYHNESNLDHSAVIIGRVGAKCGVVHITEEQSWVTDNALIVDYNEKLLNRFFLAEALSHFNLNHLSNSSAQPVISGEKIYAVVMALPPVKEQERIASLIVEKKKLIDSITDSLGLKVKHCALLKESLLQKAFEGRLVKQIPSEGTGHELIERISKEKKSQEENKTKEKVSRITDPVKRPNKTPVSGSNEKAITLMEIIEYFEKHPEGEITADLLTATGYHSDHDSVEKFYIEIRELINSKKLILTDIRENGLKTGSSYRYKSK